MTEIRFAIPGGGRRRTAGEDDEGEEIVTVVLSFGRVFRPIGIVFWFLKNHLAAKLTGAFFRLASRGGRTGANMSLSPAMY